MSHRRKILIIDDEQDITFILRIILEGDNFRVDTYNDPRIALSNYRPNFYDLIVLDLKLPYMSGYEVYNQIRITDKDTKICFLTSSEHSYQRFQNKENEIYDVRLFVQKPVENQTFLRKIKQILEQ